MEIYNNEEQQVEAIKAWWKEYGNMALGGIAMGLALVYGYRFYQDSQIKAQEKASDAYEQLAESSQYDGFLKEYNNSGYTPLVELKLAKVQVEAGEYEKAEQTLAAVANSSAHPAELREVARFRQARVLLQLEKFDAAVALLNGAWSEGLKGAATELKGDALARKGDTNGARAAYAEAMLVSTGVAQNTLKMKMGDLTAPAAE